MFEAKMKLGELLLEQGLIMEDQLLKALDEQKMKGGKMPLGEILVDMGAITEDTLVELLSKQFNYPCIQNVEEYISPENSILAEEFCSQEFMLQHMVMPLSRKGNLLQIAIANPLDLLLIDNLKVMTSYEIAPVIVGKHLLEKSITAYFNKSNEVEALELGIESGEASLDSIMSEASEGQVVRIVNLLIIQAVADGASDIHFEPIEGGLVQVRYRIDGELMTVPAPPPELYIPTISRIKILARLDIAEKRLPQDGSIVMSIENRNIDFRVSSLPTIYGEKVVIRILDKGVVPLDLDQLGINKHSLEDFKVALSKPYGLILVTGPTGSGKTTTLYACLNYVNDICKNIITLEDPVEYKLSGINQVSVRAEIGLDFASGLRAFLRQDPDVIMLGEIRDSETAEMSAQAALTGHLVLSTLHTNNAIQSLDRLVNMGIERVMISSSLLLIVAQRLVRKLCVECKEEYQPDSSVCEHFGIDVGIKIFKPKGCVACNGNGYRGRIPLHETLLLDDGIRTLISKGEPTPVLRQYAREQGMIELREVGIDKVIEGLISLEEVLSATG